MSLLSRQSFSVQHREGSPGRAHCTCQVEEMDMRVWQLETRGQRAERREGWRESEGERGREHCSDFGSHP